MSTLPTIRPAPCVVKVGGSLFRDRQLAARLRGWLARQASRPHVFIAGGGELADVIRDADRRFAWGERTSHDLCLDVLPVSARWLAALLPELPWIEDWDALRTTIDSAEVRGAIFDSSRFFRDQEPTLPPAPVPACWDVTSDSLAARLAECLGAAEVVLLKSEPPAPGESVAAAARRGYVDPFFPIASRPLVRVRFETPDFGAESSRESTSRS